MATKPKVDYESIINTAAEQLESRFREIQDEIAPLRDEERQVAEAIHRIVGSYPQGYQRAVSPARVASTAAATSEGRQRAPRGENKRKVMDAVDQRSGITVSELSEVTGITKATLYNLTRTMIESGEIQRVELPGGQVGFKAT